MAIYKANEIKVNDITYNAPKLNSHGGNMVALSYNGSKIQMQIPKARLPFGLNSMTTENGEVRKSIDISFGGLEENPALQEFYDFVRALDARHVDETAAKSETLLKKKMSKEVVQELYRPLINDKSEGKWPATMRFKMHTNTEGEFIGSIFSPGREKLTEADITKGSHASLIVECSPMYFVNKNFGQTWKVVQMKLYKKPSLNEYSFRDDEDEDEVDIDDDTAAATTSDDDKFLDDEY